MFLVWLNQGGQPCLSFSNWFFQRVCTNGFSLKYCGVQFLGKLGPQAIACVDLFTELSSNKFCSTVTHIVHHKTCSVTTYAQSHLMLRPRMAAKRKCSGTNKKSLSLLVVVAVAVLMLQ